MSLHLSNDTLLKFTCHILLHSLSRTFVQECVMNIYFSYFSTKTYVVGTQMNRLNETVLLSTQNIY